MDLHDKDRFLELWQKFFPSAELPITLQYSKMIDRLGQIIAETFLFTPPLLPRPCLNIIGTEGHKQSSHE
jgi:hypothetical protein